LNDSAPDEERAPLTTTRLSQIRPVMTMAVMHVIITQSAGVVVISGHPVPVGEPYTVGDNHGAVLVAVPRVVGVRPVHDLQGGVPEAGLPERRVPGLRLREVIGDALDVAAVAHRDVDGRVPAPDGRALAVDDVVGDVGHAVAALVRVDVPGDDEVGLGGDEPPLELHPHRLALHVVVPVAAVPRRVHEHDQPRRGGAVHARQLAAQPLPLRRVLAVGGVGGQHDDVRGGDPHRVPERRRRRRRREAARRRVPVREGLERHRLAQLRGQVQLVVAHRPHPRLVRRAALHEPRPRVPPGVVVQRAVVGVREVADVQHRAAAVRLVVRQRRVGVERLAQVACVACALLLFQSHGSISWQA